MIWDNTLIFSTNQAVTADAASTNVLDLGKTGAPFGGSAIVRDLGVGNEVPISVLVTETFNNLTSMNVKVDRSPDNATWTTVYQSGEVPLANLVAGYQFKCPAELDLGVNARYVRLYYDITGTAPTTGKITAGVVAARQTNSAMGVAI
ncbi:hypothetical protein FHW96_000286 [Novosphingobium sp. SG751A]|uniref:Bbp16 family capsid cement protein n=1 Tax=Novosphingobium sp. SG751A TaxID=2587000 RepID=UPI001553EDE0|nr:hypothetical protein [Novosphingobium sp. SG751A]NOW44159.1 hypothetical protein [Novosphingobium sp. SG751A]